jgi:hypothetical protein
MASPGINLRPPVFNTPKSVHGFQTQKHRLQNLLYFLFFKEETNYPSILQTEYLQRNYQGKWNFRIPVMIFK